MTTTLPEPPGEPPGPGKAPVGPILGWACTALLWAAAGLTLYVLMAIWPHKEYGSGGAAGPLSCDTTITQTILPDSTRDPVCARVVGWTFPLWGEQRLLLIVIIAGALGGILHALRSLGWYIGQRDLRVSWLPLYLLMPMVGSVLAVVFYLVLRGGLTTTSTPLTATSPFGVAAVGVIVGLFSTEASLKLKQVAETFFTKAQQGRDAQPQKAVTSGNAGVQAPTSDAGTSEQGDLGTSAPKASAPQAQG